MQTIEQSREMAKLACEALADKKGEDIRVIDIAGNLCAYRLFYYCKRKQPESADCNAGCCR